jgi:hypothetical protein
MYLENWGRPARGLRRYVRLVAEELGCSGDAFSVETEAPVSAYLPLEDRVPAFPERDLALLWTPSHGWHVAVETASGEDLIVLSYVDDDVLPPPAEVAAYVRDLVAGGGPGRPNPRDAPIGVDLLDRLAAYTSTGGLTSTTA